MTHSPLSFFVFCIAVGALPERLPAQSSAVELPQAERVIRRAIARGDIPGAVLVVGRSQGVIYRQAFGRRIDGQDSQPLNPDAIFDLASLTKPIATASSILRLVETGRLKLDDPVAEYLPAFGVNGKAEITVRQLLLHRGGLIPDNALADYSGTTEQSLANIFQLKTRWEPGTVFKYSDVGYIVLGELVRAIDGRTLDRYFHESFAEPLELQSTAFNPPEQWHDRLAPTEAEVPIGRVHDPRAARLGGVAGHAGLFADGDDLARFAQMLLNRGAFNGRSILKPETIDLMTRHHRFDDGARTLGFDADTQFSSARGFRMDSKRSFGHTGFTGTMIWIDPANDLFLVLLTSRLHPDGRGRVVSLRRAVSTLVAEAILEPTTRVQNGIDRLIRQDFAALENCRVGLITNHTGRSQDGRRTIDWLHGSGHVKLTRIFSPEHGLAGVVEGGEAIDHDTDRATGLPVYSLYGKTRRPTEAMLEGLDTIVFDIQDAGTRYYTYISTMGYAMEAAARHDMRFVVLDRPNPLGGRLIDGPVADADRLSFVCYQPIPIVHGMTAGELARYFNQTMELDIDLEVVPMQGWKRSMRWPDTGQVWHPPSPNLRTPNQAALYPAVGLLEMNDLSVGRGTDTPFELVGAPWIDGQVLAAQLDQWQLPGVACEPILFTPTASRHAGKQCEGVRLIIREPDTFEPTRTGLSIARTLSQLYGDRFDPDRVLVLLGNEAAQQAWQVKDDMGKIQNVWSDDLERFRESRRAHLIYPD